MLVTIGLKFNSREIKVKTDLDEAGVRAKLLDSGDQFVEFEQVEGGTLLINPSAVAYVEMGSEKARTVGFGAF